MLKTDQAPEYDPLKYVRGFADSMAEGLIGPEDIGLLYLAIAYAEAQIRPVEQVCNHLIQQVFAMGTERRGGVADGGIRLAA